MKSAVGFKIVFSIKKAPENSTALL